MDGKSMKQIILALLLLTTPALAGTAVVVDGDTLKIGDVTYRLHGIDTPEAGQKCNTAQGGKWQCGKAATQYMMTLVSGQDVQCDDRGADDFDRTISVCTIDGTDINAAMVASGNAWAFHKFSNDYSAIEDQAKAKNIGIWQAATQTAEDWRAERWAVSVQVSPKGCPIKGNISNNGHIYHVPWSRYYNRTKITLSKGEKWFCSERQALDAGWRAPLWGG